MHEAKMHEQKINEWKQPLRRGFAALMIAIMALALGAPAGVPAATAQDQAPLSIADTPSITVSGTGRVDVQPDHATIRLGVETQAEVASDAIEQNNEQMQALIDALTAAGVAEEDLQTQSISLMPIYQEGTPPVPEVSSSDTMTQPVPPVGNQGNAVSGYRATNVVLVQTDNIDEVGTLIDTAVQAGGNRVEGINFSVSDQSSYLADARSAAWEQARSQAEQIAELAGGELGRALTIYDYSSPAPLIQQASLDAAAASAVPIAPGTQSVDANLQVTWELIYPAQ